MSDLFLSTSTGLFIIFTLVLTISFGLIFVYRYLYKKLTKVERQLHNIQNEIRAINSGNVGMGRKLNRFAEDITNVEIMSSQQNLPNVSEKIYRQAGLLLARGATVDEVVESCEITPAEAELLAIMHHSDGKQTVNA